MREEEREYFSNNSEMATFSRLFEWLHFKEKPFIVREFRVKTSELYLPQVLRVPTLDVQCGAVFIHAYRKPALLETPA